MSGLLAAIPLWLQGAVLLVGLGLGLIFLLMPFAVFGVKPRLEEVELQLGELRAELRSLSMRLSQTAAPPPSRETVRDDDPRDTPDRKSRDAWLRQDAPPAPSAPASPFPAAETSDYADDPLAAPPHVSQILRPTHFDPPAAPRPEPPRPPRPAPWKEPPHQPGEASAPVSKERGPTPPPSWEDADRLRYREEMAPRPTPEEERLSRPRSEPTLRWPPRQ
ncbi:hypothetical protein [Acidomonas methanolica]|uniref:hypothetical protein n=1 Tax=Acidomonas methanolica TaxID=437 RepID=UPI00211A4712|nr:hypothetical protein [Acidomonas methanolica]MCQ9155244.1 hypothetical protein [Acidomonas methanolica]